MAQKISFHGILISVQPRFRLLRSFDERHHNYLGFKLIISGMVADEKRTFAVGIGKAAQGKHGFRAGDRVSGQCEPVESPEIDTVEFYKVSKLRVTERPEGITEPFSLPMQGCPPDIEVYRQRGHRRLAVKAYEGNCLSCIWGAKMAVEIIIDKWNPGRPKYRTETFCYGPKNCPHYKAGPNRKVPGRRGMSYVEEDWVDEDETRHRNEAD